MDIVLPMMEPTARTVATSFKTMQCSVVAAIKNVVTGLDIPILFRHDH